MKTLLTSIMAAAAALVLASVACAGDGGGAPGAAPGSSARTTGDMRDLKSVEMSKQMSPGWNLGNTLEALPDETSWAIHARRRS